MLPCSLLNVLQCRVVCEHVRERLAEHTEPVRERNGVTTRDVAPLQKRHGRATVRYLVRYLEVDVGRELPVLGPALVGGLWLMWWLGFNLSVAVAVTTSWPEEARDNAMDRYPCPDGASQPSQMSQTEWLPRCPGRQTTARSGRIDYGTLSLRPPALKGLFRKYSRLPNAVSAYWSIATMIAWTW